NPVEMQFWLGKVVAWGQADSPETQKDTCLHLSRLRDFLQLLLTHISNMGSTTEAMTRLPFLGQFLGRLCWNPYVTADGECTFHWTPFTLTVLCQLATEEDDAVTEALVKHMAFGSYGFEFLHSTEKIISFCLCFLLAASEACVPLVTYSEAAPLIGTLLHCGVTRSSNMMDTHVTGVCFFSHSQLLFLEEQAVISLWCHSLPSLERAVLSLLESALTKTGMTLHSMEQQLTQSVLVELCVFPSRRGQCVVFEAWFLLVQCAHWVQAAVQLLVTAGPDDCGPLLWLLTFYHHPTNRGHHRTLQLVRIHQPIFYVVSYISVYKHRPVQILDEGNFLTPVTLKVGMCRCDEIQRHIAMPKCCVQRPEVQHKVLQTMN
uniref:FA complementation group C n=1 Tax=Myripristis murdjan TaxID=586833 RepID=A0A667X8B2_9TELE